MAKELKIRMTFTEQVLGSAPNNEDIFTDFIAAKAPDAQSQEEEIAALGADKVREKQMTVFPRGEGGKPFVWDYQIKGFFKDSCGFLRKIAGTECSKLKAYKKEIDGLVFPQPRKIYFQPDDIKIGKIERPLRASTVQGERVALAISETIPAGSYIDVTIMVLKDDLIPMLEECLDYGSLHGFGQWRSSGAGRFQWQLLEKADHEIADIM